TVRPACGSTFIILCRPRTIHPKSVVRIRSRIPKNVDGRWSARILANAATPCWPRTTDYGQRTNPMATVKFDWKEMPPANYRRGALTFGNFDGVHRGHAALLDELIGRARALLIPAIAVTFDPHPLQLLRPQQFQPVLTTVADRAALLQANGAAHVVIMRTTPELLHLSARAFFDEVIRGRLDAQAVVPGFNFRFGHNREGT